MSGPVVAFALVVAPLLVLAGWLWWRGVRTSWAVQDDAAGRDNIVGRLP